MSFHDAIAEVIEGAPPSLALDAVPDGLPRREVNLLFRLDARFDMGTCATRGLDPSLAGYMEGELLDPRTNPVVAGFPGMRRGQMQPIAAFADPAAYRRSDAYRRFAKPAGAEHAGAFLVRRPTGHYVAVTGRRAGDGWFSDDEARRLGALYGELARACDLRARLTAAEAVGHDGSGALLLDTRMRPVRVFGDPAGLPCLRVVPTGVAAVDPRQRRALECAFGQALRGGPEHERRLVLRDARGALHVVSLAEGPTMPFGRTIALRSQPLVRPVWTARSLRDVFGLTPREAAVALEALTGRGTTEIGEALGMGPETVKTHLGGVFAKTGASSRVRLISRLLGHDGHERAG